MNHNNKKLQINIKIFLINNYYLYTRIFEELIIKMNYYLLLILFLKNKNNFFTSLNSIITFIVLLFSKICYIFFPYTFLLFININ